MKVLVVGGGGREHALCWGLARSPRVTEIVAAPGNAGIAALARTMTDVPVGDLDRLVTLTSEEHPGLVVVGPEGPLVGGLVDRLLGLGFAVFGPVADAARLEGSKSYAKDLMVEGGIPTARSGSFSALEPAVAFVDGLGGRAVVKADGLAAGKGVTVATTRATAVAALRDCLEARAFGDAGTTVMVEELLEGPEVSAFALVDANTVAPLALSQDHKRVGDGDTGPNTGGMGAYSPLPWVEAATEQRIWSIVRRTVAALRARGVTYGLALHGPDAHRRRAEGARVQLPVRRPRDRGGDPEARERSRRPAGGHPADRLADVKIALHGDASVTVVLAAADIRAVPRACRSPVSTRRRERQGRPSSMRAPARSGDTVVTGGGRVCRSRASEADGDAEPSRTGPPTGSRSKGRGTGGHRGPAAGSRGRSSRDRRDQVGCWRRHRASSARCDRRPDPREVRGRPRIRIMSSSPNPDLVDEYAAHRVEPG